MHRGEGQVNVACSIVGKRAGKPWIGNEPRSLRSGVGSQPGDDVVIDARLSAAVNESKRLIGGERPSSSGAVQSGMGAGSTEDDVNGRTGVQGKAMFLRW